MKKANLVIVVLMTILVFLTSASLNPSAAASCARSNFLGAWERSTPANSNDKIKQIEFRYYGSNGCALAMSMDGVNGIVMKKGNDKNTLYYVNNGLHITATYYPNGIEKVRLITTVTENGKLGRLIVRYFTRSN